ncbi:hypothetical protein BC831DRAFT_444146, partial [Entophlyctis helioformis]
MCAQAATLASHHVVRSKTATQQPDDRRASRLGRLLPWLFAASHTLVWAVVVAFWLLLTGTLRSAPSTIERLSLINGHTGSLVVAVVDLVLCKTTLQPRHALRRQPWWPRTCAWCGRCVQRVRRWRIRTHSSASGWIPSAAHSRTAWLGSWPEWLQVPPVCWSSGCSHGSRWVWAVCATALWPHGRS